MPHLALWLVIVWFLALFVFRTALQWWRTGSSGLRGFSGAVGSLEWNVGLLTSVGLVAGLLAPVATLASWPGGSLWFARTGVHCLGAAAVALGIAGALAAQMRMGDSWRIGVDAGERTRLVTDGLYARVRNPIYSFMALAGVGLLLLLPSVFSLLALGLTFTGIELHVRRVEEPHLARMHGEAYRDYASRIGRFVPGVGRGLAVSTGDAPPGGGDGRVAT